MTTSRVWVVLCAAIAGSTSFSTGVYGQTDAVAVIVDDPRPVAAAVLSLTQSYPVTITYEDPRYEYLDDIRDVTDEVRRSFKPSSNRILIPLGGVLEATYQVSRDTGQPSSVADALQNIVDAKNANPVGGRFGVFQSGDAFHVVPTETRDGNGAWVAQESILSTPISFSSEELNGYELIERILKQVSETSGANILGLSAERFANAFFRYTGRVEAKDEPARDVLLRALHSISPRFTWHLNYDPSGRYYVFAVELAAEPPRREVPPELFVVPRPGDPSPVGPAAR